MFERRRPIRRGATPLTAPTPTVRRSRPWGLLGLAIVAGLLVVLAMPDAKTTATALDSPMAAKEAAIGQPALEFIVVEAAAIPMPPPWHEETVREGDNLSLIFSRAGFSRADCSHAP